MRDRSQRRGLTLIDLLVMIVIVGIGVGLLLPATTTHCNLGRKAQCQNNLKNIALGLIQYSTVHNVFPQAGTFFDDPADHHGDPTRSNLYRAVVDPASFAADPGPCRSNWVVAILPYIDQWELFNEWSFHESYLGATRHDPGTMSNALIADIPIKILMCPDDPTARPGQGNLSYAPNGGFSRWQAIPVGWDGFPVGGVPANGGVLRWAEDGSPWQASQAVGRKLGVMSLGTTSGDQPWDHWTRPADITDGASTTLLLSENTLTGYSTGTTYSGGLPTNWACPLPNFCMFLASDDVCQSKTSAVDCLGGQLRTTRDGAIGPGWSNANRRGKGEGVNDAHGLTVEGSHPFANGGHPRGFNAVFCDGSVKYLDSTIDGGVYARIITPAGGTLPEALRQPPLSGDEW